MRTRYIKAYTCHLCATECVPFQLIQNIPFPKCPSRDKKLQSLTGDRLTRNIEEKLLDDQFQGECKRVLKYFIIKMQIKPFHIHT